MLYFMNKILEWESTASPAVIPPQQGIQIPLNPFKTNSITNISIQYDPTCINHKLNKLYEL